jgi:hypothetical protein
VKITLSTGFSFAYPYKKLILTLCYLFEEIIMSSLELKDDEEFQIFFYEVPESFEVVSKNNLGYLSEQSMHYTEWLKDELGMFHRRLVNVIRHPDMNKNVLIHYFAVLKE